jgi:threonine dehydrogenase-like Zn-dependent dehydrogenase
VGACDSVEGELIRQSVWFVGPGKIEVRDEVIGEPGQGQVLVRTCLSAISSGTEMLLLRGLVPEELHLDDSISSLSGEARFPFKYGYCSVGSVAAIGADVDDSWLGRRVFSFHPHESAYLAKPDELISIPETIDWEDAVFLPNMETALNLVMDAAPLAGETAVVFGLGIVGILTTAILAQFPLGLLAGVDPIDGRREIARQIGAGVSADPREIGELRQILHEAENAGSPGGVDLVIECSGAAQALDSAISITGFEGRIVIGSWYGKCPVELHLGGKFHRSRIRLVSSQVTTLAAGLTGRWTKERRFQVVWEQIRLIKPSRWISHRHDIHQAAQAYQLLMGDCGRDTLQVVIEYP